MPSPGVEPGLPKPQSGVLPLYYKGVVLSNRLSTNEKRQKAHQRISKNKHWDKSGKKHITIKQLPTKRQSVFSFVSLHDWLCVPFFIYLFIY